MTSVGEETTIEKYSSSFSSPHHPFNLNPYETRLQTPSYTQNYTSNSTHPYPQTFPNHSLPRTPDAILHPSPSQNAKPQLSKVRTAKKQNPKLLLPFSHTLASLTHTPSTSQQRNNTTQNSQLPLTPENLARVQQTYSNRETYLQQDQNFERVPLGLATNRGDGHVVAMASHEAWRQGGRGEN